MATAIKDRVRSNGREASDWLVRLLADVRPQVIAQPTPQAVARIRRRLSEELKPPRVRAAA